MALFIFLRYTKTMYKRVLLKLSGEILLGKDNQTIDQKKLEHFAREIKTVHDTDTDILLVLGGGNIFRNRTHASPNMDRVTSDHMGMMATVINSLAMQDMLERLGLETRVLSALEMNRVAEPFIRRRAMRHIEKRRVVILAAGTGNPYFSTDTAAALRASELECDVLIKGTNVDGIYDKDPDTNPDAVRYESVSYQEALEKHLAVMDSTAFALASENKMPIIVFNIGEPGNLLKVVQGEKIGTLVG